ncbi:hypothetical protein [Tepidicaulis marinus]|uniref:hypothetical protein n=1 Tax=Tepidicaulis marinus TaxID=1333998 RepID=UPI0012DFFC2D|nr:hypothetical protein [Tepidicaulis marinus]
MTRYGTSVNWPRSIRANISLGFPQVSPFCSTVQEDRLLTPSNCSSFPKHGFEFVTKGPINRESPGDSPLGSRPSTGKGGKLSQFRSRFNWFLAEEGGGPGKFFRLIRENIFIFFRGLAYAGEKIQKSFKKVFDTPGESPYKPRSPGHGASALHFPVERRFLRKVLRLSGFCGQIEDPTLRTKAGRLVKLMR